MRLAGDSALSTTESAEVCIFDGYFLIVLVLDVFKREKPVFHFLMEMKQFSSVYHSYILSTLEHCLIATDTSRN